MEAPMNEPNKIKELILYISERLAGDSKFGSTKLNKILFFSDFIFYRRTGNSITGQSYWKLPNGPAPKLLMPIREEMLREGSLTLEEREYWGRLQKVPIAKRTPNLTIFTPDELELVNAVINVLRDCDASECSELSHDYLWLLWDLAELKETIPYGIALITCADDDTQEQLDYCDKMQRRAEAWLATN